MLFKQCLCWFLPSNNTLLSTSKCLNMKHLTVLIILILLSSISTHAQTSTTTDVNVPLPDSAKSRNQAFYFPATLFNDSVALWNALPQLAQQVAPVYSDPDKATFYENAFHLQMVAQHYKSAMVQLDSLQQEEDADKPLLVLYKSYVQASQEATDTSSFRQAYTGTFKQLFNALSFNDKTRVASMISPATMKYFSMNLQKTIEKLKKNNKDSITLSEAQSFCSDYNNVAILRTILPLTAPLLPDDVKMQYPIIKTYEWAGVVPVQRPTEIPDPALQYKLLMELTWGIKDKKDSTAISGVNMGLGEVGRLINLHAVAGIPRKNMAVVVVVHGPALFAFYNNAAYKKKYGIDNPNMALLHELQKAGVKMIACGQAMNFFGVEQDELIPGVKLSLTAQTVLSSYQLKQYVYYDLAVHDE